MFPWISVLVIALLVGSIWRLYIYLRHKGMKEQTQHLVVISANSQATIEWWLRSYIFWNWIHGKTFRCTCMDLGSIDDTLAIVERLRRRFFWIEIKQFSVEDRVRPADQLIPARLAALSPTVLDLRQPENRRVRSFVQHLS